MNMNYYRAQCNAQFMYYLYDSLIQCFNKELPMVDENL